MPYREYCVHRRFGIYTVPYMTEVYEHYEEPLRAELQRHVETEFVADRVLHAIENDILCIFTHDAERILRRHLLPAQLRDVSFIDNPPNHDGTVGLRDVANRHLGAFGFSAPYGHESVGKGRGNLSFNMDIVGGAVGSICEAYRDVVRIDPTGHRVNSLIDYETNAIRVQSPYNHDCLRVELKQPGPLYVRIPPWLYRDEIHVEDYEVLPIWTNGYLFFSEVSAGQPIQLRFPLKELRITLSDRLHVHPIRIKMGGDAVVVMDNFGADLTFFDPYE